MWLRGETIITLRPCEQVLALDAGRRQAPIAGGICLDVVKPEVANQSRTGLVNIDTGKRTGSTRHGSDAVFGPPGSVAENLVAMIEQFPTVTLALLDATTGQRVRGIDLPDVIPLFLAFSADGKTITLSSQTGDGLVVDVEAVLEGAAVDDATEIFADMSLGPLHRLVRVGDVLATSGNGTQVRLWESETGRLLTDVPTDPGEPAELFAHPDGSAVFYQDAGGVLRRLLLDHRDLAEVAQGRVQRGFTDTECERYSPTAIVLTSSRRAETDNQAVPGQTSTSAWS